MQPGGPVEVVYRKYDGSLHWHERRVALGRDAYGLWLGAGPRTPARRGHEPPVVFPQASALLVPDVAWWSATFNAAPDAIATYCDIGTPAELAGDRVTMIDLDLDVVVRRDGTEPAASIVDADEFAEHRLRYAYPADVVRSAERAAAELLPRVWGPAATEPFRSAYAPWLDLSRDLAPLEVPDV